MCIRDRYRRTPDTLEVKAAELHEAVVPQLASLTGAVRTIFERIPPQPVSYTHLDVYKRQGPHLDSPEVIPGQAQQILETHCLSAPQSKKTS